MPPRVIGHVSVIDDERDLEPLRQRTAKRGISIGAGAANVVMQVRQARQCDLALLGKRAKDQQQRDRIGAAGDSRNHRLAAFPQPLALHVTADLVNEPTHMCN